MKIWRKLCFHLQKNNLEFNQRKKEVERKELKIHDKLYIKIILNLLKL